MATRLRPVVQPATLRRALRAFPRAKVLVVGDVMLDEFVWGKVSRISPEAPVPVVWVQSESIMPGGAANVAGNLRALGGRVTLIGLTGQDRWGQALVHELDRRGVDTRGVVQDASRPTTVKTRVIAHHQQVVRVDRESADVPRPALVDRLIDRVRTALRGADALILEDYGKGVISRALLEAVLPLARKQGTVITVDPKKEHIDLYQRVTSLTPNRAEAGEAVGRELVTDADVVRAGHELIQRLRADSVLITLGEDGMCLVKPSGRHAWIPTVAQEVFDVAGAGDTVIATFTLALASRASLEDAAMLANAAAGVVVGKVGVAVATPQEISSRLSALTGASRSRAAGRARAR